MQPESTAEKTALIWTEERKALALATAEHWLGVPYRDRMSRHGVGIDCVHLVQVILIEAGILTPRALGKYDTAEGIGKDSTALADRIREMTYVEDCSPSAPEFGDVVVMKTGLTSGHCGFYADGLMYHALARRCVTKSPWGHWKNSAQVLLRFTRTGYREDAQ